MLNMSRLPVPYNAIDPSECPREFFATHLEIRKMRHNKLNFFFKLTGIPQCQLRQCS